MINTIYSNTFENFISLKGVLLPKTIKKIESKAFNNCSNLLYIEIPDNCKSIKWDSFCNDEIKDKMKRTKNFNNKKTINKRIFNEL